MTGGTANHSTAACGQSARRLDSAFDMSRNVKMSSFLVMTWKLVRRRVWQPRFCARRGSCRRRRRTSPRPAAPAAPRASATARRAATSDIEQQADAAAACVCGADATIARPAAQSVPISVRRPVQRRPRRRCVPRRSPQPSDAAAGAAAAAVDACRDRRAIMVDGSAAADGDAQHARGRPARARRRVGGGTRTGSTDRRRSRRTRGARRRSPTLTLAIQSD